MVVLSRKTHEAVVVGGSEGFNRLVVVRVLEIRGATVKLGFELDAQIPVHRWEVWEGLQSGQPAKPTAPVAP